LEILEYMYINVPCTVRENEFLFGKIDY
jgi:hypothetical protein